MKTITIHIGEDTEAAIERMAHGYSSALESRRETADEIEAIAGPPCDDPTCVVHRRLEYERALIATLEKFDQFLCDVVSTAKSCKEDQHR